MEKILSIAETSFSENGNSFSGFIVTTDKQTIKLGITDYQSCCESWGYFMSEDDISSFVGSNLLEITITDNALATSILKLDDASERYTMFVNINTTEGLLQFVAYNAHNGYYGHEAIVRSTSLNVTEVL